MTEGETIEERSREVDRLLTFVDAIVAIAITLLVLPLVDVVNELDGGSVGHLLREHRAQLGAFLLSFAVIARLWLVQHHVVVRLSDLDTRVYALMMGWALTIVFLPFPTALLAQQGHQPATKVLYIGTTALSTALMAGLQVLLARVPALRLGEEPVSVTGTVANTVLLVIALVIALAVPPIGYWAMALITVDGLVLWVVRRLRR